MPVSLTVIVPIYKMDRYIDQCIRSIVQNTYRDMEIVLVDDGSPDCCPEICEKWREKDDRIKVIHKKNGGLSSARNAGIDIASGKWISFIDADDWIDADYYEQLFSALGETQSPDIFLGGGFFSEGHHQTIKGNTHEVRFYSQKEEIELMVARTLVPWVEKGEKKTYTIVCQAWNKLYRTDFIKKNDLKFDTEVNSWEDSWFNFCAFMRAELIGECPYIGYHYRILNNSISHGFDPDRPCKDDVYRQKLYGYLKNHIVGKRVKQAIYQAIITAASEDLRLCYLNPQNTDEKISIKENIKELKNTKPVREAVYSQDNTGFDRKRLAVKYLLRMKTILPMEIIYRLLLIYQMKVC